MKLIGNIIWFLFGGLISAIAWFIAGIFVCLTIVGIPFGIQCFKIAGFVLWPFNQNVTVGQFGAFGLIGNILWLLIFGWELAFWHLVIGFIFYVTVIGIPFGKQHMKFAQLAFVPFGAKISYV